MKVLPFNNYSQNNNQKNPNFGAIRSVQCIGLYEKNPQFNQRLEQALDKCYSLKDFSKKYDVDIIFDAWLRSKSRVENSISIIFENPSKSKILGVLGSKTDKIEIGRDNDLSNTAESFTHSTMQLIDDITSGYCGGTGRLEHAVKEKAKEIEKNTININM